MFRSKFLFSSSWDTSCQTHFFSREFQIQEPKGAQVFTTPMTFNQFVFYTREFDTKIKRIIQKIKAFQSQNVFGVVFWPWGFSFFFFFFLFCTHTESWQYLSLVFILCFSLYVSLYVPRAVLCIKIQFSDCSKWISGIDWVIFVTYTVFVVNRNCVKSGKMQRMFPGKID